MPLQAKILADSLNEMTGDRLTTWKLTYPRSIHSEVMTHRVMSRNSASSRAIPSSKMIASVLEDTYIPDVWEANQAGMSSSQPIEDQEGATKLWLEMRDNVVAGVREMVEKYNVHKQWANRALEPWSYITVILTATEWDNFYLLRAHDAAAPSFRDLAYKMLDIYNASTPDRLAPGLYHVPYGENLPVTEDMEERKKVIVARCARNSYLNFEGEASLEDDLRLWKRLLDQGHMSPFEHVAVAQRKPRFYANFRGFEQVRTQIEKPRLDPRIIRHAV